MENREKDTKQVLDNIFLMNKQLREDWEKIERGLDGLEDRFRREQLRVLDEIEIKNKDLLLWKEEKLRLLEQMGLLKDRITSLEADIIRYRDIQEDDAARFGRAEELKREIENRDRRIKFLSEELESFKDSIQELPGNSPPEKTVGSAIKEENMKEVHDLVAGIAHQLRNPIAIIRSNIQFCLKKYRLKPEIKSKMESIFRNIEYASKRLEEMVYYSYPINIDLKPVDLSSFLDKALLHIMEQCRSSRISLRREFPNDLPEIRVDAKAMQKAVLNICVNAIESMSAGGSLTVRAFSEPEQIVISFIDTGLGMTGEIYEKALDPFFTTKKSSFGLGLNLALRIIRGHKGTMDIRTEPEKGTTVNIRLPLQRG